MAEGLVEERLQYLPWCGRKCILLLGFVPDDESIIAVAKKLIETAKLCGFRT